MNKYLKIAAFITFLAMVIQVVPALAVVTTTIDPSKMITLIPGAHITDASADAPVNLNVITTLLGTLTSEVNNTNAKQNAIALKVNLILDILEANGLMDP